MLTNNKLARFSSTLALLSLSFTASALEFQLGDISGQANSEVAWGAQWSVQEADERYLYVGRNPALPPVTPPGNGNGGTNPSPNQDNGRLNYNTGLISNQVKFRTEVEMQWQNFGTRTEVMGFYDFYIKDHKRERTQPSKESDREIAADFRLLQNYVYWDGFVQDTPVSVRVGDQVIAWGEANLIPGANTFINPIDFNRVLSPTFDIEELYRPIGAVFGSVSLLPNVLLEAYVQYDFEPHRLPPGGSFYGITDNVGPGRNGAGEDFFCYDNAAANDTNAPGDACTNMLPTDYASQNGQWGAKVTFTIPELNYTNLSLFYVNFHDKLPVFTVAGAGEIPGLVAPDAAGDTNDRRLNLKHLEDIELWGVSFNTNTPGGYSLAGELTLRKDAPLQIHRTVLSCAAGFISVTTIALQDHPAGAGSCVATGANQLPSATAVGQPVDGFRQHDIAQAQFTIANTISHVLGGDTMLALMEVGFAKIIDMPDHDELTFETADVRQGVYRADDTGWGYRILVANEYNNFLPGLQSTLRPAILFAHDVNGEMPSNLNLFQEEKKQLSASLTLDYLNRYSAKLEYRTFFGAKDQNLFADRDNINLSFTMDF